MNHGSACKSCADGDDDAGVEERMEMMMAMVLSLITDLLGSL